MTAPNASKGMNVAIMSTTLQGIITCFDKSAEHLLGYRSHEVIGKCSAVMFHDVKELRRRAEFLCREKAVRIQSDFDTIVVRARPAHPVEDEWTYLCRDGTRIPVLLSVTALPDNAGETVAYLLVAQHLRERHDALKNCCGGRPLFLILLTMPFSSATSTSIRSCIGIMVQRVFTAGAVRRR